MQETKRLAAPLRQGAIGPSKQGVQRVVRRVHGRGGGEKEKGSSPLPPQQQQQYVGVYARMAPGEVNISVNLKSVNRGSYIQYNPGAGNG
jgi:hypothetical protein